MSKRRHQGIDKTFLNCAVCHASTVRDAPEAKPRLYLGHAGEAARHHGVREVLLQLRQGPEVRRRIHRARSPPPGAGQRAGLRPPRSLRRLPGRRGADARAPADARRALLRSCSSKPRLGPGPRRHVQLGQGDLQLPDGRAVAGTSSNAPADFPSIWLQGPRQGMQLHWDGNNTMVEERNKSAAFGTGTTPPTLDLAAIGRIEEWLLHARAAEVSVSDRRRARRRAAANSTRSTAPPATARAAATSPASDVGKVTPIAGDRHRSAPARFLHLRSRGEPGDALRRLRRGASGISARPSATPTCRSTACGCARRTCTTARCRTCATCSSRRRTAAGSSIAATTSTTPCASGSSPTSRPTATSATSGSTRAWRAIRNAGHEGERYGTELPAADKDALVEFLKTF